MTKKKSKKKVEPEPVEESESILFSTEDETMGGIVPTAPEPTPEPVKPKKTVLPPAPDFEKHVPYAAALNPEQIEAFRKAWKQWVPKYVEAGGSVG